MTGILRPRPPAAPLPGRIAQPAVGGWRVRPERRLAEPDCTGFYESGRRPADDQYAGVLMQVNQAGRMIAGWAVPPPTPIRMARLRCFDRRTLDRWSRREIGLVFIANRDDQLGDGSFQMRVAPTRLATRYGPDDEWYPIADPTLVIDRLSGGGEIWIGSVKVGAHRTRSGEVQVLEVQFQDTAPGFEPMARLNDVPRVSADDGAWKSASGVRDPGFHAWVTGHARPLPTGYLDDKAARLAPDVLPSAHPAVEPPLAKAIREWAKERGPARMAPREHLLTTLKSWFGDTTPHPHPAYAARTKAALIEALSLHKVGARDPDGNRRSRTYLDWITAAYMEEREKWMENKRPRGNPFVDSIADMLGIPHGEYLYTFTFSTGVVLPIPLPKAVREKVPQPGRHLRKSRPGVTVGFNPFYADVKREKVEVKVGPDGLPLADKDGRIVCTRREAPDYDTSRQPLSGLIGLYLDLGIGVPKPGIDVKQVEVLSANATLTKDSFDGASFRIGQVRTGSVGSAIGRAQGPGSSWFSVSKHADGDDYDLSTTVEIPAGVTPMKATSKWDFFKQLFDPKALYTPSFGGPSFGAAFGWFRSGGRQPTVRQTPPQPGEPAPPAEIVLHTEVDTFFEVDSNTIPRTGIWQGLDPRSVLEAVLAQERALLINPHLQRQVTGWASPEGTSKHNLDLSLARARALAQAYLDAFAVGAVVPVPADQVIGLGEAPSLRASLDTAVPRLEDPETVLGMTAADPGWRAAYQRWLAAHQDQVGYWPQWRRAQFVIDGRTVISVSGPQQP